MDDQINVFDADTHGQGGGRNDDVLLPRQHIPLPLFVPAVVGNHFTRIELFQTLCYFFNRILGGTIDDCCVSMEVFEVLFQRFHLLMPRCDRMLHKMEVASIQTGCNALGRSHGQQLHDLVTVLRWC